MSLLKALATVAALVAAAFITTGSFAQQPRQLTAEDYAHAEQFMSYNVNPLVYHSVNEVAWLPDDRFWFRDAAPDGVTFTLVDPANGTKAPAFDHAKLATALSAAQLPAKADTKPAISAAIDPHHLPITTFSFTANPQILTVTTRSGQFRCDLTGTGTCTPTTDPPAAARGRRAPTETDISPDKSKAAFIRDYNLWVRDIPTGKETQLTTDGVKDYGYATDNAGWTQSDHPILVWSPDSKKIATFQQDQRKDGEMYLVSTNNGHPTLKDLEVSTRRRQGCHHDRARDHRSKRCGHSKGHSAEAAARSAPLYPCVTTSAAAGAAAGTMSNGAKTAKHLAFVSTSRDHKQEWLRVADAATGDIREVMGETVAKFYESGNDKVNWHYLPKSNDILWFSERDNWGQLYLYDLTTGKLKNQVTHGDGNVTQVLTVDEKTRTLYFLAVGKEKGSRPLLLALLQHSLRWFRDKAPHP